MNFRLPVIVVVFTASFAVAGCATVPDATEAHDQAARATNIINQMNAQPGPAALLRNARAVLIVPDYIKASFILGEQGGDGVLLTQRDGRWGDPMFYSVGGVSVGLQAGIKAGTVAYLLMTPRAMQEFENRGIKTTLGADAGLTLVKYSSDNNIVSSFPTADVVVWTGTTGLYAGVALDSSHVVTDQDLDKAYHQRPVPASQTPNGAAFN